MTDVVKDLHAIIEKNIDPVLFPYKKGNKINIGSYSVARGRDCYTVKSYKSNQIIAETFSKTAAVAVAKTLNKKPDANLKRIQELDHVIMKHYIDCMFFRNSLKKASDPERIFVLETRYDISWTKVQDAREKIESYIF